MVKTVRNYERDAYDVARNKLEQICLENRLEFRIQTEGYPFSVSVTPDNSMEGQLSFLDSDIGRTTPDAAIVWVFEGLEPTVNIRGRFVLADDLVKKLGSLARKLHAAHVAAVYHDVRDWERVTGRSVFDLPAGDEPVAGVE